jgi:hypothetical protein
MDDALKSKVTSVSTRKPNLHKKIQSFDVDVEQLARELMMPSKDVPLTSFKLDSDSSVAQSSAENDFKQVSEQLRPSRTVDVTLIDGHLSSSKNASKKKSLFRSLTQNR